MPLLAPRRTGGRSWRHAGRGLVWAWGALALGAGLVAAGVLALDRPALAVGVAVLVLVAVLASTDPLSVAVLAVLGVWITRRGGAGGLDISGSDALLAVATFASVPFVPWSRPSLRRVLAAVVVFEAVLFVTVLAHPSAAGLFEWGHRLFLTGGAVVVGAALAHHGRTRPVLSAFLAVTALVGAAVAAASVTVGGGSAEILGFHKNFIGSMMLAGLAVSHLAPSSTGFSRFQLAVAKGLCAAGLLGSQSRGAIIALLAALVVAVVRSGHIRRRSAPLFVILVPLALFAFFSLRSQVEQREEGETSSITERDRLRDQGLEAWRESPVFGQGMRFFERGELELRSDPHNVVVGSLSETGVVGLAALVGLLAATVRVTWRLPNEVALAALTIVVARFVHGLFDIYWVAATQTLPWLIVGMALGHPGDDQGAGAPGASAHPATEPRTLSASSRITSQA
ncbi:MAG: O-antigen ligase family protein [Actinomycetota bacterium]|nr:O-antigen ligase family protein [Actinomycetota bacterium]